LRQWGYEDGAREGGGVKKESGRGIEKSVGGGGQKREAEGAWLSSGWDRERG